MAQEQNISTQLNDLLVTRNYAPEMLDRQGKPANAEDAKTFTFDYVSGSGKNYGTMVVILDSDNDMKVFYGDNLGRAMEGDDKDQFFDFQQQLNKFARMHRWTYTAKDLSQLKHTMQGLAAIQEGLFEGYYGTRKISYAGEPTEARLMIKHNRTLGETDARFRYVESLFIETADNQRFKLAFKNLSGGRAMLEHVRQGGNPYDVRGVHITEMVQEIGTLSRFNRASAARVMEGATQELIAEARAYYKSLRENMKRMASPRGYQAYFETWHPATIDEQQDLVEDIKTLFIEQTLDTRIEAALPLLARIQQQGNAMKEAQIFENWVNSICEGTWAVPETPEQEDRLRELLSQELIVGADATNATEQLYDLIGDDELFDRLGEIAQNDPNADVRQVVIDRLAELGYDLGIDVTNATADNKQGVEEGYYDLNDEGMQPIDLSANPSFKEIVNRYTQLVYQGHAGETSPEEDKEYDAIEQYVARRFGEKGSAHLQKAGEVSYWGRDDKPYGRDSRSSNLGQPNQPGGDFRTTKAGKMHGQDARMMKAKVADRLGRHPEPNLPEDIHALEESLRSMLKSAGMAVSEGRILDEAGETLDHILTRFKHEVKRFEEGDDLDSDLYYALFDYYSDHGEIPYGIAKGRDGDPFEWVTDRLDQELGTGNHAPRDLPEADPISTFEVMSGFATPTANEEIDPMDTEKFTDRAVGAGTLGLGMGVLEGSCNSTMEGEYCPEHGLMECGGMMEMGTVAGGMAPVVGEANDDPINYNGAITGSYYEGKQDPLSRIKSLALRK